MSDPFIIMSAPNGARRQKADHPAIPLTAQELAACAVEITAAGATILHLHVRDDQGRHSLDVDRYRAAISAIHDALGDDIIIQATSESVGQYSRPEQMAMVKELRPEAVSLALRELCPDDKTLPDFADFTKWMTQENIFPQYILYDATDYQRFEAFRKQGVFLRDMPFALFVLGNYAGTRSDPETDQLKKCSRKSSFPWAVCGFGLDEKKAVSHAVNNHGHMRVGFENNIWHSEDMLLSGHTEMIRYCTDMAKTAMRPVATVDDVRKLFQL